MEHERQRALHRKLFEDQLRALEQEQAQELLSLPADSLLSGGGSSLQHLGASAPTTPPHVSAMLNGKILPLNGNSNLRSSTLDVDSLSKAVGTAVSDKRKSVTYASSVNRSPGLQAPTSHSFPNTSKPSVIFRHPDPDVAHPPAFQTVSPASMLRDRSRPLRTPRFPTRRPI